MMQTRSSSKRPFDKEVTKQKVWKAYKKVVAKGGSAGIDNISTEDFKAKEARNLRGIHKRMATGSYIPKAIKAVEIPKANGGVRVLGIPTVGDRIAQTVVKDQIEVRLEKVFHEDSYAFRPKKSHIMGVRKVRQRSWKYPWVLETDIRGLFDNIDHELLMKAVKQHVKERWVIIYIERWIKAAMIKDGNEIARTKGIPQGGVISPVLANLFLHYAFDHWIDKTHKDANFVRYADDVVIHCKTKQEAEKIKTSLEKRMKAVNLEMHPEKTSIVYCWNENRPIRKGEKTSFDFLGFTFCPRKAKSKTGEKFISFLPAISEKARKLINTKIRKWGIRKRSGTSLKQIAEELNPIIRGWVEYYGKFYKTKLNHTLFIINGALIKWAERTLKKLKRSFIKAGRWLKTVAYSKPNLFYHWKITKP